MASSVRRQHVGKHEVRESYTVRLGPGEWRTVTALIKDGPGRMAHCIDVLVGPAGAKEPS